MTVDDKLAAILAVIQQDVGGRGLARDPHDNLFTACPGDFAAACRSIADHPLPVVDVVTGFLIPSVDPPRYETDGPLGAVFLARALAPLDIHVSLTTDPPHVAVLNAALREVCPDAEMDVVARQTLGGPKVWGRTKRLTLSPTHVVALERVGPAGDGRCRTMRGRDVTDSMLPVAGMFAPNDFHPDRPVTIGIGDGGNEIGMGKVTHETVVRNVPNGDHIHCVVPTDYLIVAGVSNWGAYAIAASIYVLRGVKPTDDLFDPGRERAVLQHMVVDGPLVDGVTGCATTTVDGLSWDDYVRPFIEIGRIARA